MYKKCSKFDSKPCKNWSLNIKMLNFSAARAEKKQQSNKTLIFGFEVEKKSKICHFLYTSFKRIKKHWSPPLFSRVRISENFLEGGVTSLWLPQAKILGIIGRFELKSTVWGVQERFSDVSPNHKISGPRKPPPCFHEIWVRRGGFLEVYALINLRNTKG